MSAHPERPSTAPRSEKIGTLNYVECPVYLDPVDAVRRPTLFLGGGISGCPDWQSEMVKLLQGENLNILNPRRENFPLGDPAAGRVQMRWEIHHFEHEPTDVVVWFPEECLAPITIAEYFRYIDRKQMFVGVHPHYSRREDIEFRTQTWRPSIDIAYSLDDLAEQVRNWFKPVHVATPVTDLKGWTKGTANLIHRMSVNEGIKTAGDWIRFLQSNGVRPLIRASEGEHLREIEHRLIFMRMRRPHQAVS